MDDYLCVTVLSRPGEAQDTFAKRLSLFWTHMLRARKDDFEKVYAETTSFVKEGDQLTRQYLAACEVVSVLEEELQRAGFDHHPIDPEDLYSRFEAVSPEWMQIEH